MKVNIPKITDPVFVKKEKRNFFERFILKFIRDERDLPFAYLSLKMTFLAIPVAIFLFIPGMFNWWIAVPYVALNLSFGMGPYVLMLHNTSHRKLFKSQYDFMNKYIPWVLGPLYGESPETYFGHHIGMHHPENNLEGDLSSTMPYQRDSLKDFGRYFHRFLFYALYDLADYFQRKNRPKFRNNILKGELGFFALCIVLSILNWKATLCVFIIPFLMCRFAMMAGNWGQHAFVDINDPSNCHTNSLTCINASYNKKCFNDGYHIGHHLHASMHWTDMPGEFLENIEEYSRQRAIVFREIDFFIVWFMLMTKNYDFLAKKFYHLDDRLQSKEEVIAFLKERLQKVPDLEPYYVRVAA